VRRFSASGLALAICMLLALPRGGVASICPPNASTSPCRPGAFACNCTHQCDDEVSCTGHGRCRGKTGACVCDLGWAGANCSQLVQRHLLSSCNAGYTPDGPNCTACVAGTYKPTEGNDGCTDCSAGTYSGEAASACSACPPHTYSPGGSPLLTNCTCNRGYHGPDGGYCAPCDVGKYKDTNGSAACTQCAGGTYSGGLATACAHCPPNTFSSPDKSECILCRGNSHSPQPGAEPSDCLCNAGFSGTDETGACAACPEGKFKDTVGSAPCTQCPAGKHSKVTGNATEATCADCPADFYNNSENSDCLSCPSHSQSSASSSILAHCQCNVGFYRLDGVCTACAAGKFKNDIGPEPCSTCPAGTYSGDAASACSACPSNTYNSSDQTFCEDCPSNSVSPESSAILTDCKCLVGYTGNDGGECVACVAGKFKDTNGSAPCTNCAAGKYATDTARASESACQECPGNSSAPAGTFLLAHCACFAGYKGVHNLLTDTKICTPLGAVTMPADPFPQIWNASTVIVTTCPANSRDPDSIYNATGDCTTPHPDGVCGCDEDGNVFTPPVTYNVTYNSTSGAVLSSVPRICSCQCAVYVSGPLEHCECDLGFAGENFDFEVALSPVLDSAVNSYDVVPLLQLTDLPHLRVDGMLQLTWTDQVRAID
jgi:hypothetical protein